MNARAVNSRVDGPDWLRIALVAGVLLLLVAAGLVARAGDYTDPAAAGAVTPTTTSVLERPPAAQPSDPRGQGAEDFNKVPEVTEVLPANVLVVAITVAIVAMAVYGALVVIGAIPVPRWRRRVTAPGTPAEDEVTAPVGAELADAVDRALDVVDDGTEREAVVACWLLLARAAATAGSPVRPSETAREYAGRLATEQLVSRGPLERLAELYREARFSAHPVANDMRVEARRALGVLQAELRSGLRL